MNFTININLDDKQLSINIKSKNRLTKNKKSIKLLQTAKQCLDIDDVDIILIGIRNELEKHLNDEN